jgi:hypothetical protein
MVGLILVFGVMGWGEWLYMKKRNRKKRTFFWVFFLMGTAFVYNLLVAYKPEWAPNPNHALYPLFKPLQDFLIINKN